MTGFPSIVSMSHVALRVRDLDAALRTATTVLGMREVERDEQWVYLTCNRSHHVVQYMAAEVDAVDHIGLTAAGPAALREIRARLFQRGVSLLAEAPLSVGFEAAIAFASPDGFVYEVGIGMPDEARPYAATGVRPTHFGHVNLHVPDVAASVAFLRDVLDFRISDVVEGRGVFLRCSAEHHGVAILHGRGILHHHAWAVPGVGELARLADLVDDLGGTLLWGPLRHGAGDNIAIYFAEPSGAVIEVYTEMEAIWNEASFRPRTWSNDDARWWSRWTKVRPEGFHDFGLPAAQRSGRPPGSL